MADRTKTAAISGAGVSLAAVLVLAGPLVQHWEGKRNDPYNDIVSVRTVCYGETYNVQERRYSDAECTAQLNASLAKHATAVRACIPSDIPVQTQAAFVSFGYNVGIDAACKSTVAKRLRAHDLRNACAALSSWVYAGGKVVNGLKRRRADEVALCLKGTPA
jgi:lysozyme